MSDVGANYIPPGGIGIYVGGVDPAGKPHSWKSVADHLHMDAGELVRFNYKTNVAEVVNFYLERNCGCKTLAADGINYSFRDASPGVIYVPSVPVIDRFHHHVILPMEMRPHPSAPGMFQMKAVFQVDLGFNKKLSDPSLYEYRQEIRGNGYTQRGEWVGSVWHARVPPLRPGLPALPSPPIPVDPKAFPVPGPPEEGLRHYWKEDGVVRGGHTLSYGHRGNPPYSSGSEKDIYTDGGYRYECGDQPGLDGNVVLGLTVYLHLEFIGSVVRFDRKPGTPGRKIVETVAKKEWSFDCLRRIKQIRPLVAVA